MPLDDVLLELDFHLPHFLADEEIAPRVTKLILDGSEARVCLAEVGLERANGLEDLGREGAVHRSLLLQLGHAFVDACKARSWCAASGSRLQWLVDLESHRRQHR